MSNAHWSYEEIKKRHDQYEEQIATLRRENKELQDEIERWEIGMRNAILAVKEQDDEIE